MIAPDYFQFWARALGLEVEQLRSKTPEFSSSGRYVERHGDKYIYFSRNPLTGKNIFTASPANLRQLTEQISLMQLSTLDTESVRKVPFLMAHKVEFSDVDYCLPEQGSLNLKLKGTANIRPLAASDEALLDDFYGRCSENEKDTLDLRLDADFALGHFETPHLLTSVARFARIPDSSSLADLTVVTTDSARGKGYASHLVSELVREVQARALKPKYRVGVENLASVAIAHRLGLVAGFQIMSWRVET